MAVMKAAKRDRTEENDELTLKDGTTDICQQLMDRYAKSSAAQHRHLVATAAAMRSILAAESLPSTPPAYFAAAISSVDSALNSPTADPVAVSALFTFLSIVVPLVPSREISNDKAGEAVAVLVRLIEREREEPGVASLRGGVKCLGTLLVGFCDLDDWKSLQLGFVSLLKFAIDKRPKVRRCAQECLEKLFSSFQSSTAIKEASNSVYSLLKEYKPLLAKLSSTQIEEGSKVDLTSKPENVEALHMLNVLSVTIPFLSTKVSSRVLSELCKLITPQFSLLTRQILKAVEAFFLNSKDKIVMPEIEAIITSLTGYLSLHEKNPADTVMRAITLVRIALEKLHLVEPILCHRNLPRVCGSLAGLLTSTNDTAGQALIILKDLITCHMDKRFLLIEGCQSFEDEDNGAGGEKSDAVRSVCAIFESSLNSCNAIPNEHILVATALLFEKLGELSYVFMRSILLKLAHFMDTTTGEASSSEHFHQCIGSAVIAMGPESILELLPISLHADVHACSNSWLIPILKRYIVGASIGYYTEHTVPLAKSFMRSSKEAKKAVRAKKLRACAHGLLGLLPAFCNYPVDVPQKFGSLAKLLAKFLNKFSFLRESIALSLQMLVNQNKSTLRSKKGMGEEKTYACEDSTSGLESESRYTKKASTKNIKALASCSNELLQALIDLFIASDTESTSCFKDAIVCLASIMDSSIRKEILMSLLEKLGSSDGKRKIEDQMNESFDEEKESQSTTNTNLKRSTVLDLASSLVAGAKDDLVELIYNLVKQTFQAADEVDHREAYHTLRRVLEEHNMFCSSHFTELMDMLLGRKSPEDVASLRSRFACFHVLIVYTLQLSSEEENEKAFLMLNEIVLALKDGQEEHRKAACDVLVMTYTTLKSSSSLGDELCPKLINMIMGYISGSSPHIQSGAVSAVSVLVYKDPDLCLSTPDILSSVLSLLETKAVEVIKAALGFVKVVVSSLKSEDLQNLLHDLLRGILPWSSVSRFHFKEKVTVIVEIMIRKCGPPAVKSLTPAKHKAFVKMVLEKRSGKSNSKEENDDSRTTTPIVSSKGSQKRKHEASSEPNGVVDEADKRSKRQKRTLSGSNATGKPKRFDKRSFRKQNEDSGKTAAPRKERRTTPQKPKKMVRNFNRHKGTT